MSGRGPLSESPESITKCLLHPHCDLTAGAMGASCFSNSCFETAQALLFQKSSSAGQDLNYAWRPSGTLLHIS